MTSQAVSPCTVTQSPEPTQAPAPLSSHAPAARISAMPITAFCLLQGTKGLLAPRTPSPPQVVALSRILEPRGGRGIGQDENQGQFSAHPHPKFSSSWPWEVGCPGDWEIRGLVTSMGVVWKESLGRGERLSAHPHVFLPCCPGGPIWMALLLLGMFLVLLLGSIILGTNLSHPSLVIARCFPKAPSLL